MMMKHILIIFLFTCTMCTSDSLPAQDFNGSFKGEQTNLSTTATLKVVNNKLTGTIIMNGEPGRVAGAITDSTSSGIIYDEVMKKEYAYTSSITGDEIRFHITFPELNNLVIDIIMQRIQATNSSSNTTYKNTGNKNPALLGIWRYTEVLSSGSGNNYGSFSTSYYMEFKSDGTVYSWKGKSAGGTSGVTIEGGGSSNADKGEWYTDGKTLYLSDASGQKGSMLFYAEANRMMLHNGGKEKKIFERVK